MHLLVIGGTGFIGFQISLELLRQGHQVRILAKESNHVIDSQDIEFHYANLYEISDAEYTQYLTGIEGVIFAAGVDDRHLPKKPAWDYFFKGNVESSVRMVELAKTQNIQNFLFIGSYFSHFSRIWPELELGQKHPYIRSRIQQQGKVFAALSKEINCTFLELPFVFGEVAGGVSLWKPLMKYLGSGWPIFTPKGGTSMVSVAVVAKLAVEEITLGKGHAVQPVSQANMEWKILFKRLSEEIGKPRKVFFLPRVVLSLALKTTQLIHSLMGKEGGLKFGRLTPLLTRELYLYDQLDSTILTHPDTDLTKAFQGTILSSSATGKHKN